jgi:hypothetical protein
MYEVLDLWRVDDEREEMRIESLQLTLSRLQHRLQ